MRRSSILFSVLALGAMAALTGCPPAYPKCSSDDACKEHGEVCVQGQCQECATDENCKEGFVCQQNRCMPKPECTEDSNCGPGRKCSAGKCTTGQAKGTCTNDSDCGTGEECSRGMCVAAESSGKGECNLDEPIHFGFNEAALTSEGQQQLSNVADCLKSRKLNVRLEGHADERGTEEYNLQLSNRRAASVEKYLADLGVPSKQMQPVGFGETRPANPGHNEAAWAQNRRVEIKPANR